MPIDMENKVSHATIKGLVGLHDLYILLRCYFDDVLKNLDSLRKKFTC